MDNVAVANDSEEQHADVNQVLDLLQGYGADSLSGADRLQQQLEQRLSDEDERKRSCVDLLRSLAGADAAAAAAELEQEGAMLDELEVELEQLQRTHGFNAREEEEIDRQQRRIGVLETQYWELAESKRRQIFRCQDERRSLQSQADELERKIKHLRRVNVFNDAFFIWYDGPFGTINGLRLGRLPEQPVEWYEISAAWGQVALLLATVAREAAFTFTKFRIIPMGSLSKMAKVGDERNYFDLHFNGGFFRRSFNNAMVFFLACVSEFGDYAELNDRTLRLPYRIEGERVGEYSIKLGGPDENWTRALKYMLTNLKWILAWCSKVGRNAGTNS